LKILVTGGAGYIGSHTCIELIKAGYEVVVVDNLCNSSLESLKRVEGLIDCNIPFHKVDVRDKQALTHVFEQYAIDGVIHFAGSVLMLAFFLKRINSVNGFGIFIIFATTIHYFVLFSLPVQFLTGYLFATRTKKVLNKRL